MSDLIINIELASDDDSKVSIQIDVEEQTLQNSSLVVNRYEIWQQQKDSKQKIKTNKKIKKQKQKQKKKEIKKSDRIKQNCQ